MAIEISSSDVSAAEEFLADLLEQNIEDGRFTEGTALRDLAVKGLAFIHAYMKKENSNVKTLQSLLNITDLSDSEDPDQDRTVGAAVDALMSNWFITRKTGRFSRGTLQVRVSRRQDYVIPRNQRFLYSRNRAFFLDTDSASDLVVPATDLQAFITPQGEVAYYIMTLRLVAARTGSDYDVSPGEWQSPGTFSPYIVGGSNPEKFAGGAAQESTTDLIDRSNSAIAERSLINERTIDATLRERFGELNRLQVIGFGDAEMLRDLITEYAADLTMHVGGHYDVYLELPVTERVYEGVLGGTFARPDGVANVFRDGTVADWTATSVQVGDIIRIAAGLPEAPKDFTIREILSTELRVSEGRPFSEATDETASNVDYFIYRPLFGTDYQVMPAVGVNTTGITSRSVATSGRILLPGSPVYDILDVAIIDPDTGDPNINGADNFVHFPVRQNVAPFLTVEPELLNFQVINPEPGTSQSSQQFMELLLPASYDGKTVRVTYETLSGYSSVDQFMKDRFERILVSSSLGRGFHPVYLNFRVRYSLKPTATGTVDNIALRQTLVSFINEFSPNDVIDTSDIVAEVRKFSADIGIVYPLTITYDLISPDGNLVQFQSTDVVEVTTAKVVTDDAPYFTKPVDLGLTDRVIRYRTTYSRVTVEQV